MYHTATGMPDQNSEKTYTEISTASLDIMNRLEMARINLWRPYITYTRKASKPIASDISIRKTVVRERKVLTASGENRDDASNVTHGICDSTSNATYVGQLKGATQKQTREETYTSLPTLPGVLGKMLLLRQKRKTYL